MGGRSCHARAACVTPALRGRAARSYALVAAGRSPSRSPAVGRRTSIAAAAVIRSVGPASITGQDVSRPGRRRWRAREDPSPVHAARARGDTLCGATRCDGRPGGGALQPSHVEGGERPVEEGFRAHDAIAISTTGSAKATSASPRCLVTASRAAWAWMLLRREPETPLVPGGPPVANSPSEGASPDPGTADRPRVTPSPSTPSRSDDSRGGRAKATQGGSSATATQLSWFAGKGSHTRSQNRAQPTETTRLPSWHPCCSIVCACEGVPWGDARRPPSRPAPGRWALFFWADSALSGARGPDRARPASTRAATPHRGSPTPRSPRRPAPTSRAA